MLTLLYLSAHTPHKHTQTLQLFKMGTIIPQGISNSRMMLGV